MKCLLIGWDAADWRVIKPLVDSGEMPHLRRFLEEGVMGNMATLNPPLSPMLWTSIATGKRPFKHGILGFTEPDPHGGGVRPVSSLSRKTKAIWNILGQNGFRSNVIGWWPSHPVEPIRGVMVSNHYHRATDLTKDGRWPLDPASVHPRRLYGPLAQLRVHPAELEASQILPFVPKAASIDQEKDPRLRTLAKILAECSSIQAAATAVMQLEPWDFMAVYFDAIDHFCHAFMEYHPPRRPNVSEEDFELYRGVVTAAYRFHDLMLGVLLKHVGDDTTVILMSDHGFHPDALRPETLPNEPAGPAAEHRGFGIFAMRGPAVRRDELVFGATVLDVCPTVLQLFGLPVGRDMDGRVLRDVFVETPEVSWCESWDLVPGEDGGHPPDRQTDPAANEAALRQLADLGYIEDIPEDKVQAAEHATRELRYNEARAYMDAGMPVQADRILAELWERWPNEGRFGLQRFFCQMARRDRAAAREILDQLKSRKAKTAREARREMRELAESEACRDKKFAEWSEQDQMRYRKLVKAGTINRATFAYLEALLDASGGRSRQALERLEALTKVEARLRLSVLTELAKLHLRLGEVENAEKRLREILDLEPADLGAQLLLARALLKLGRYEEALKHATNVTIQMHRFHEAHFWRAMALEASGDPEAAAQALRIAVEIAPDFIAAHLALARVLRTRKGDWASAIRHRRLAAEARRKRLFRRATLPGPERVENPVVAPASDLHPALPKRPVPLSDSLVIVSGLPRSGTSMLMRMLEAGGLPIFCDGVRKPDDSNVHGYFEHEKVKRLWQDATWVPEARGNGVKIVAPLLPALPPAVPRRVILLRRSPDEVLASQRKMLDRLGRRLPDAQQEAAIRATFEKHMATARRITQRNPNALLLELEFSDVLEDPRTAAGRINEFLDGALDVDRMVVAVDPQLRHHASGKATGSRSAGPPPPSETRKSQAPPEHS